MTQEERDEIRRRYASGGEEYDRVRLHSRRGAWLTKHDTELFDRLLPAGEEGDRVLEVGAGTGRFTRALLDSGYSVVATDINESQLDQLERNLGSAPEDTYAVEVQDIFDLTYDDAAFDLVVAVHVIPRLLSWRDQRHAISELARVVALGGHLLFNYRNAKSIYRFAYDGPKATHQQIHETLSHAGMRVTSVRSKHLLNGRILEALPHALWKTVSRVDRSLETRLVRLGWDVFVLAERHPSRIPASG